MEDDDVASLIRKFKNFHKDKNKRFYWKKDKHKKSKNLYKIDNLICYECKTTRSYHVGVSSLKNKQLKDEQKENGTIKKWKKKNKTSILDQI